MKKRVLVSQGLKKKNGFEPYFILERTFVIYKHKWPNLVLESVLKKYVITGAPGWLCGRACDC